MEESQSNEELLRLILRGGTPAVEAAKKILLQKDKIITSNYFLAIIENIKTEGLIVNKEEAKRMVEEAAVRIIEGKFLNEQNLFIILDKISSAKIAERAGIAYRANNESFPNHVLKKIIERIPKLRIWATRKILEQNPSSNDLQFITLYLKGELLDEVLRKQFEMGLSSEDAFDYIEDNPLLAEPVWEKMRQDDRLKEFTIEQLFDIFKYTEAARVREEARKQLKPRIEEELKKSLEAQKMNPEDVTIKHQIEDLRRMLKTLEGEPQNIDDEDYLPP